MDTPEAPAIKTPVRRLARPCFERQRHDPRDDLVGQRHDARWARLFTNQAREALAGEPLLPPPDTRFRDARLTHDLIRGDAIGTHRDDPPPPHVLLRCVAVSRVSLKSGSVFP